MDSVVIFCAKYLIIGVLLIAGYVWLSTKGPKRTEMALAIISAGVLAAILTKLAGKLYFHPRPFVTGNIKPLIAHGADNGFPSEHTVLATTLATIIYFYRRWLGLTALVIGLLIGWARVAAHVHSVVDILGGLAIGLAAGSLGYLAAYRLMATKDVNNPTSIKEPKP